MSENEGFWDENPELPLEGFPSADEIPESNPDMWNPSPGEVPGTGGMVFPDGADQHASEYPDEPAYAYPDEAPAPAYEPSPGPPPGWEVIDEYGNPTGYDAYGNPVAPDEPLPESPPPHGFEVLDEYGNPTGYDAYGDPVPQP